LWLSVVPVLPAAGRPPTSPALSAVPPLRNTPSKRLVTPRATSGSTRFSHALPKAGSGNALPSLTIDITGMGGQ
jgi:hypothetical protein